MKTWIISDTHFGHKNIIPLCRRPYRDADHMNEGMISRWNADVQPGDLVYHLGDFAMGNPEHWQGILSQLNGDIVLIQGNHDHRKTRELEGWIRIEKEVMLEVDGRKIAMRHHPYETLPEADIILHGHVHGVMGFFHRGQLDMSCDLWNYRPTELSEVIAFWDKHRGTYL